MKTTLLKNHSKTEIFCGYSIPEIATSTYWHKIGYSFICLLTHKIIRSAF